MASRERFLGAMSWLQFQGASASISRMNRHHFSHDRATIGPRSGRDQATIVVMIVRRSPSFHRRGDSPTFALRLRLDRAAIAVRSDRDRGVLPRCVWIVRLNVKRVDGPIAIHTVLPDHRYRE